MVSLEMPHSQVEQLWDGGEHKVLHKLRFLDLSDSKLRILDLRLAPNLETLDLQRCSDLAELSDGMWTLKHLRSVKLNGCLLLEKLPEALGRSRCLEKLSLSSTKIKHLPDSICTLKHLKFLDLSCCKLLEKLPEDIGRLECLKELWLEHTSISHMPQSILLLKGMRIYGSSEFLKSDACLTCLRDDFEKIYCNNVRIQEPIFKLWIQGLVFWSRIIHLGVQNNHETDPLKDSCKTKLMDPIHQKGVIHHSSENAPAGNRTRDLKEKAIYTYKDDERITKGKKIRDELPESIEESQFYIVVFSKNYASSSWCLQELVKIMENEAEARIKGMGGVGKTTLARAVFDAISIQFEGKSFVENVREVTRTYLSGLKSLQQQILSDVLNEDIRVSSVSDGKNILKQRMCGRKVVIALDDVDDKEQLEALAGKYEWFKPGSRIIVTTRDEQVLLAHGLTLIRDVNLLSNEEAICLFSMNAFKRECPVQGYEELAEQVVRYADGLPLTIKVLGSLLFGKDKPEWEDALIRLKTIPLAKTLEILELSYTALEGDLKEIFPDVACILKGWQKNNAIQALESCGFRARFGLRVLQQKSLLTCDNRQNCSPKEETTTKLVEKRSRNRRLKIRTFLVARQVLDQMPLDTGPSMADDVAELRAWKCFRNLSRVLTSYNSSELPEHVISIKKVLDFPTKQTLMNSPTFVLTLSKLMQSQGTEETKCLWLNTFWEVDPYVIIKGIAKMKELRFLGVTIRRGGYDTTLELNTCSPCFPDALGYLWWDYYPFRNVPKTFKAKDLVSLEMRSSKVEQLWVGGEYKVLDKLQFLYLNHSNLRTLDLRLAPNLETLNHEACYYLEELPDGMWTLQHLRSLNLDSCKWLEKLPEDLGHIECLEHLELSGTSIKHLPDSICMLKQLKFLHLSSWELLELPKDLGQIECLEDLDLSHTEIKHLPSSICLLKHLKSLRLSSCKFLEKLPKDLSHLECLEDLDLSNSKIKHLPNSICILKHLKFLHLSGCELLELPKDLGHLECLADLHLSNT
ncbi:hypothetical protein LXL04_016874 [Taraxacum kok-saghyz]